MRLLTYLFAAALLWAVATSGPATPPTDPASHGEASAPAAAPVGARAPAYPR